MKKVIEAEGIMVQKGRHKILDVAEFTLRSGEVLALIGPNGAGKSTLMQVLALLQRPARGKIFFLGEEVTKSKLIQFRRRMAVVFQEPLLLDTTVYDNVAAGLYIRKYPKEVIAPMVERWLERFGILSLARRTARYLSGGEAQRVSLARAFVLEPEVLFLDEPFSSLDYPTRQALIGELGQVLDATRVSTIFVTHDYNEVLSLADRVSVILRGEIVQSGTPQQVMRRPANDVVASLFGGAFPHRSVKID